MGGSERGSLRSAGHTGLRLTIDSRRRRWRRRRRSETREQVETKDEGESKEEAEMK